MAPSANPFAHLYDEVSGMVRPPTPPTPPPPAPPPLDFSHLYGDQGGQVKAAKTTPAAPQEETEDQMKSAIGRDIDFLTGRAGTWSPAQPQPAFRGHGAGGSWNPTVTENVEQGLKNAWAKVKPYVDRPLIQATPPEMQLPVEAAKATAGFFEQHGHPEAAKALQGYAGIMEGEADLVKGMSSPKNLAMMYSLGRLKEAGAAGQALDRLISSGFSVQQLWGAYKNSPEVKKALDSGNTEEAAEALTNELGNVALGVTAAHGAVEGTEPFENFKTSLKSELSNALEAKTPLGREAEAGRVKMGGAKEAEEPTKEMPTLESGVYGWLKNNGEFEPLTNAAENHAAAAERLGLGASENWSTPAARRASAMEDALKQGHIRVNVFGHADRPVANLEAQVLDERTANLMSKALRNSNLPEGSDITLEFHQAPLAGTTRSGYVAKEFANPEDAADWLDRRTELGLPSAVSKAAQSPEEAVAAAGGVYRGTNSAGLVEITLPREMADKIPGLSDRFKDFVSVTLPADKVTPENVKAAMDRKMAEMGAPVTVSAPRLETEQPEGEGPLIQRNEKAWLNSEGGMQKWTGVEHPWMPSEDSHSIRLGNGPSGKPYAEITERPTSKQLAVLKQIHDADPNGLFVAIRNKNGTEHYAEVPKKFSDVYAAINDVFPRNAKVPPAKTELEPNQTVQQLQKIDPRYTWQSIRNHEAGHAVVGEINGFPAGEMQSHLHPRIQATGGVARQTQDFSSVADLVPGKYGEDWVVDAKSLSQNLHRFIDTYMAGGLSQEAIDGIPFDENRGTVGDKRGINTLLDVLGLSPEERREVIAASQKRVRSILSNPAVQDTIKKYTTTREPGLDPTLHMSAGRASQMAREAKEAYNASKQSGIAGRPGESGPYAGEGRPDVLAGGKETGAREPVAVGAPEIRSNPKVKRYGEYTISDYPMGRVSPDMVDFNRAWLAPNGHALVTDAPEHRNIGELWHSTENVRMAAPNGFQIESAPTAAQRQEMIRLAKENGESTIVWDIFGKHDRSSSSGSIGDFLRALNDAYPAGELSQK
jgi:hypothetical protein